MIYLLLIGHQPISWRAHLTEYKGCFPKTKWQVKTRKPNIPQKVYKGGDNKVRNVNRDKKMTAAYQDGDEKQQYM